MGNQIQSFNEINLKLTLNYNLFVLPEGFEPSPTGPEPVVLSVTPWEQKI
jgi:hypothetical protein